MENIIIKKSELRNLEELTQFAYRINGIIEHSSAFCSCTLDAIRSDFETGISSGSTVHCMNGNQLIGLMDCYVDHEKNNADCSLLIEPELGYGVMADKLLSEIRKLLGSSIQLTFFFPKENIDCSNFLDKIGAHREVNEYSLLLKREDFSFTPRAFRIIDMPHEFYAEFIEMHDSIFPDVYVSGKDIINDIGKKRYVYTIIDSEHIIAYGVLKLHDGKRVTAEIVAVKEGYRHKGYGRAILAYIVNKAFTNYEKEYVDLIVDGDNDNAILLYLDLGFVVESENCCYTCKGVI